MRRLASQLWFQVLLATALGVLLGLFWPSAGARMKPLGDAFIALIRMIVAPVIFCTVVHGIAGMRDMRKVGRVAVKSLVYFELITTAALIVALLAVNVFHPGAGMNVDAHAIDTRAIGTYTTQARHQGVAQYLLDIIPTTFVGAFARPEVLPTLFVSVLFAIAVSGMGERGKIITDFIGALSEAFFRIVGFIMWIAPIGAFGAMAFTVGQFGAGSLLALAKLLLEFYLVSLAFVAVVFGAVAYWAGVSLVRLLAYIRDEIVIVAATTSTETVLPRLMQKLRALGCEESVVGLVVPAGYSFNLDGTCLYLSTAVVFLAQATNTHLGIGQQLAVVAVLLLTSKGAAGVAGAAFVVLAATLGSLGTVPIASIALILGIHRLMAEALTFVNLVGNSLATIVVAKWEKAVDYSLLYGQIGRDPRRALAASYRRPT
ncbi:MAG TPA: C4-dicarboxylate transporter DctA [Steroidobacteraceae bacterium]|jgi:aerobic C4-dicarboxylate transport protein|nr:C4-dicarboxylate transporter DctA [Steroidobacteraceae bacterium]